MEKNGKTQRGKKEAQRLRRSLTHSEKIEQLHGEISTKVGVFGIGHVVDHRYALLLRLFTAPEKEKEIKK